MASLLNRAKAGMISSAGPHVKVTSNKGSIADVRKRVEASLRDGGFPHLAMTGAQTALSAMPEESKIVIDIDISEEPPASESEPKKDILRGRTRRESEPKDLLPGRTKQSERAPSEEQEAEPPKDAPPFFLPAERPGLQAWKSYYVYRYGKQLGLLKYDELSDDSKAFTVAVSSIRALNKKINAFNSSDSARFSQWARNALVDFGSDVIDVLGLGAQFAVGMKGASSGGLIEQIKGLLKEALPRTKNDFVKSIKAIQANLLAGKPHWKAKLNAMAKLQFEDFSKKILPDDDPAVDKLPDGKQKEMGRF